MMSRAAKRALGALGKACGKSCGRPWVMREMGKLFYPDGREIKGSGVHELINEGVLVPDGEDLFGDRKNSQKLVFNPSPGG